MRAVTIAEDRSLQTTEVAEPALESGQVRIEVAYCGICGTDLHLRPSPAAAPGTVMGHELSGRIADIGPGVEGWAVGERVCVLPFESCGECPPCRAGNEHLCVNSVTTGLGLGTRPGAYAETVAVAASTLFRLPDEISDEHGALVEPLAVALHAIALAEADPAEPAVVIGAGPIGLMTALGLRARGFERLVVIERNEGRRARIESLGVPALGLDDVHMGVLGHFGGELPAAVLECAGNPAAPQLAIELVRPRGSIVLVGALEEPVPISQLVLMLKEARLQASFAYQRVDFENAIELIAREAIPAEPLVTAIVDLDRAQEMFDELVRPDTEHVKVLLAPSGHAAR